MKENFQLYQNSKLSIQKSVQTGLMVRSQKYSHVDHMCVRTTRINDMTKRINYNYFHVALLSDYWCFFFCVFFKYMCIF